MKNFYSIQEISQMLGIPRDTLRYYDRIGIVSPAREENRYRQYAKTDLINLMNIQIMQYAGFSLNEIRRMFGFHKAENITPAYCEEVAAFLDLKNSETRKKIDHLERVSQLLNLAADTLRNFNDERDQRLAKVVRETYREIRASELGIQEERCHESKD